MVAPPSTAAFFVSRKRAFIYEPPTPWFLFTIKSCLSPAPFGGGLFMTAGDRKEQKKAESFLNLPF